MQFRAVVLAAGESKRMGAQKLLVPYRGRALVEYAVDAALRWNPLVVASADVARHLHGRTGVEILLNEAPQSGMAHSLALADAHVDGEVAFIVLLADKPLVTAELIDRMCGASEGYDVVFPRHPQTHEPGHPVLFSPCARRWIATLGEGDSLRMLRDEPALRRLEIPTVDAGAYFDVDTAAELCE